MKRLFDILFSTAGLLVLSPLMVVVAVLIRMDSPGPAFFRQERVGRYFRPFTIYKFRTMMADSKKNGSLITVGGDRHITRAGKFLRKYKIDELPQLFNILKGDMSFVGPRPEVKNYVELFRPDYKKLLRMRPGITDPASIKYSSEERVLAMSDRWEEDYIEKVLPEKIRLSLSYVEKNNVIIDLKLIFKTLLKVFSRAEMSQTKLNRNRHKLLSLL
ncbi:UDP-N-acetylgalactosamine-undecaprenyl-phosphate N-acetylgalactosaminephosphotransferase [bacterium BMS3Abin07]|nr:UDP-N-acetylgalactosamine-undecaprenyl-phosphate N-acetylgalactosaminephosphotransferase [bacterium BMS3Abin07]HDO21598.1 sugar transferase [Nitrospirota bacterium]HDZ88035.1 sugar transferase [Nitrospirota bacterium]